MTKFVLTTWKEDVEKTQRRDCNDRIASVMGSV